MRLRTTLFATLFSFAVSLTSLSARQVGDLGDFDRFEFRSLKTYSTEQLRDALKMRLARARQRLRQVLEEVDHE